MATTRRFALSCEPPTEGDRTRATGASRRAEPPPHAAMGLLNYLTATSLDEDYAVAASNRERTDAERDPRSGSIVMVVLAVFGILLATAAVQTSRSAADEQTSHDGLVRQISARKKQLANRRERAEALRAQTDQLQDSYLRSSESGKKLQQRLSRLAVAAGVVETRGPGARIVADDGPPVPDGDNQILDVDLQQMVNGLWLAGAEALAIDGQRLTSLSAIRQAGANITATSGASRRPTR